MEKGVNHTAVSMQVDIIIKAWYSILRLLNDEDDDTFLALFDNDANFDAIEDGMNLLIDMQERIK